MSAKLSTLVTLEHELTLGDLSRQLLKLPTSDIVALFKAVIEKTDYNSVDKPLADYLTERAAEKERVYGEMDADFELHLAHNPPYDASKDPDSKYYQDCSPKEVTTRFIGSITEKRKTA